MPGAFYREYYGLQFKHAHHIIRGDICGGVGVDKYDEELKSILPKTAWEDRMAAARKSSRTQTPETPVRPGGSRANVPESFRRDRGRQPETPVIPYFPAGQTGF